MPQNPTITVTINNKQPVELLDFTRSLLALGEEFRRSVHEKDPKISAKLYVKELRKGSLVAELMVIAPYLGAAMEASILTHDFIGKVNATLNWLRGIARKPDQVDTKTVKNISTVIEPVAKDAGATCSLVVNGDVNAPIVVNNGDAKMILDRGYSFLQAAKEPEANIHTKVVMYWATVKNEDGLPPSGEKAKIDKLSERPLKVVFDSRELREEMLQGHTNPLKEAFVVDVETQTVNGKLVSYKVLQMHERFRVDDEG